MWKRIEKNQFGDIQKVTRETDFTRNPVYDDLRPQTGAAYNKANLTAEYTVEYFRKENAELVQKANTADYPCEPWDLKDEYLTDSMGLAIRELMIRTLHPDYEQPLMSMYIKDENGNDAEIVATLPSDTAWTLRNIVNKEMNSKISALQEQVSMLTREINTYKDFLGEYHATETYKEWRKKNEN